MYQTEKNLVAKFMQVEDIATYDPANKWDHLIPVCAKIDMLDIPEKIDLQKEFLQLSGDLDNAVTLYEKYPVFRQVIRCIEWYNQKVVATPDEPQKTPITTLGMEYKAEYDSFMWCWSIQNKEGGVEAWEIKHLDCPSFTVPTDWLESRTYLVELKTTDGCTNSQCNWSCNGCTAKGRILDITNNMVTILKYL